VALSETDKQKAIMALGGIPAASQFVGGLDNQNDLPDTSEISPGSAGAAAYQEQSVPSMTVDQLPDRSDVPWEEGAAETGATGDIAGGFASQQAMNKYFLRQQVAPVQQTIEAGENFAAVGGRRGKERYEQAFDTAPNMGIEALAEGAITQEKEGRELADFYKKEQQRATDVSSNLLSRRMEDEQGELQRQAELDQKSQQYTQNLSDRGAFWKNPGNIMSAIAFALMPLAGAEKGYGMKLLNNAIQADFTQRKNIADGALGELRSNLSGYRTIAKDRQAGDLLAQAEGYRVAAMEVQRIAASYQGEKAQNAAKAMAADLMNKSNVTAMEAYNRMRIYQQPTVMTKQMQEAFRNLPGYSTFNGGVQRPQIGTKPIQGNRGATIGTFAPQTGGTSGIPEGGYPAEGTAVSDLPNAGTIKTRQPTSMYRGQSDLEKVSGMVNERAPGVGQLMADFDQDLDIRAKAQVPNWRANPGAVLAAKEKMVTQAIAGKDKVAAALKEESQNMAGTSIFQKDLNDVQAAFGGDVNKVNEFLGLMKGVPGEDMVNNFLIKSGWSSEKYKQEKIKFQRLSQAMNGQINQYYRKTSGGAVTSPEQVRLEHVVSQNSPFELIKAFARDLSRQSANEFKNAIHGQDPLSGAYYLAAMGQRFPALNSPGK